MTRILAIETSCDETAAAVVEDGRMILSNVVATQIELHQRYGGIFPEVASRQHVLSIQHVIEQALSQANINDLSTLDAVAVTHGPGLAGSLLVGVNTAKGICFGSGLPLIPVNHLEGHVYSNWIAVDGQEAMSNDAFPVVFLIVSGGHTELVLMTGHGVYQRLGSTLDDAAGEAFDKVARLLGLGFPGGPAIQKAAQDGDAKRFALPRPLQKNSEHRFNFSFSGLKTAVLNLVRKLEQQGEDIAQPQLVADLASSFQTTVVDVLMTKTIDAVTMTKARQLCVCGGVSANAALRTDLQDKATALDIPLYIPPLFLCTDNAAMIGAAAHYRWQTDRNAVQDLSVDVFANLPLVDKQ